MNSAKRAQTANTLETYGKWKPSQFDTAGLGLSDRQHWLVAPCGTNRDADLATESNFDAMKKEFKAICAESEGWEEHSFGHWANGWFAIILIDPTNTELVSAAEKIVGRLDGYPLLDEDDHSEREYEAAYKWWDECGMRERIRICDKYHTSIFAARRGEIPENVEISYLAEG